MLLRPRARASAELRAEQALASLFVVGLLAGLVWLSQDAVLVGFVACLLAGFVTVLFALGVTRTGAAMVLLGMVTAPMTDLTVIPGSTLVTVADACFAVGFALLVPALLTRRASPPPLFMAGAIVVLMLGFVASVRVADPAISLNLLFRLTAAAIVFPVVFMFWQPDARSSGRLAGGYVVGVALSTLYGLFVEGPSVSDTDVGRYDGLTEHPNAMALTGLLAVALLPHVLHQTARRFRWLWLLPGGLCLYGMWLSGSRATLLVLILLALLYPAIENSVRAAGFLVGCAGVGLLFVGRLLQSQTDNPLTRLLGGGSAGGSDQERENNFTHAIAQFKLHPLLGNGFADDALAAHDIYLQVAVSVGVIGLVAYLCILWTGLRPLFRVREPIHLVAYPVLAYLMTGLLTSLLWDRYIWCVLALSFVLVAQHPDQDDDPGLDSPTHRSPEREVAW
jgi:O-antigen ligase